MSLTTTVIRIPAPLPAVIAIVAMTLWSCGPSGTASGDWAGDAEWNEAVGAFIAGDFDNAVARLEALAKKASSEEQFQEVYWYLGRAYLETERYSQAIDAFRVGKAHGGGGEFDEYLIQLDALVSGEPENVQRSERITRVQLAVLIDRMFFSGSEQDSVQTAAAPAGSVSEQMVSVERGVLESLPDGRFHPEAFVTRAAFYVSVARLLREIQLEIEAGDLFPGGFGWALGGGEDDDHFVTGKEAFTTLQRVAAAKSSYGGQGS
jgi:hypothetical protein